MYRRSSPKAPTSPTPHCARGHCLVSWEWRLPIMGSSTVSGQMCWPGSRRRARCVLLHELLALLMGPATAHAFDVCFSPLSPEYSMCLARHSTYCLRPVLSLAQAEWEVRIEIAGTGTTFPGLGCPVSPRHPTRTRRLTPLKSRWMEISERSTTPFPRRIIPQPTCLGSPV